jgi:hypothetical protein
MVAKAMAKEDYVQGFRVDLANVLQGYNSRSGLPVALFCSAA